MPRKTEPNEVEKAILEFVKTKGTCKPKDILANVKPTEEMVSAFIRHTTNHMLRSGQWLRIVDPFDNNTQVGLTAAGQKTLSE